MDPVAQGVLYLLGGLAGIGLGILVIVLNQKKVGFLAEINRIPLIIGAMLGLMLGLAAVIGGIVTLATGKVGG
jgi:uncharacterized membrane protein